MSSLQAMTPPALEHLVERCLAKEREERWQSMADIAHELEWLLDTRSDGAPSVAAAAPRGWRAWLLVAVSVASLVIAAAVSLVHLREPAAPPPPVLRYTIPLPKVGAAEGLYFQFHLSPDGAM
jgi:serine/threonine-protein kinase